MSVDLPKWQKARTPYLRALVLVAAVAGVFWIARQIGAPEIVMELEQQPSERPVAIIDGALYLHDTSGKPNQLVIRSRPIMGGERREVLRVATAQGYPRVQVSREGILYGFEGPELHPYTSDKAPGGAPIPQNLPVPPRGFRRWNPMGRGRLWMAPLSGGTPRELLPERRANSIHVVGETCYWIEDDRIRFKDPILRPLDNPPKARLFAVPVAGGNPRLIATFPCDVHVQWGRKGVFWGEVGTPKRTLAYSRPPDFSPALLTELPETMIPVELGDRLYWTESSTANPTHSQQPGQLVSVRADGSDRHVTPLAQSGDSGDITISIAGDDGSNLLLRKQRIRYRGDSRPPEMSYTLLRYRPDTQRAPEPLRIGRRQKSVNVLAADQGFLYFAAEEERENWFDWSPKGLTPRVVQVLYRTRLPQLSPP